MTIALRILIVEDSADDAEVTVLTLSRDGLVPDWKRVETADELRAALAEGLWDAVLADFSLPGFSAAEALALCRKTDPDLPFVVVSGTIGEQRAVEMMRAGAGDYLLKGNLARLSAAVEREVREAGNRRARRRAEVAMRASAELLRSFVEYVSAPVAMFDRDMRYLHYSRRWLTDYHLGDRNLAGQSHYEVFPDAPSHWKEIHQRCLAGATDRCDEARFERADGTVQWIRWDVRPWLTAHGEIGGIIMFTEDVTERKRSENALQVSEARFRAVVESDMLATFFWQEEGLVTEANDAFLALVGYSRDELRAGRVSWFDLTPPDHRDSDRNALAEITRTGRCIPYEKEFLCKDGSRMPVLLGAASLNGGAEGVAFAIDQTGRKKAEERLAQAAVILANVRDSVIVTDTDGVVNYWNEGAYHLFGWTAEEMIGRQVLERVPEHGRAVAAARLRTVQAAGEFQGELEDYRKDGSRVWVEYRISRIRDLAGTISGHLGVARDITSRKNAESSLRASEERYRTLITATAAMVWNSPASGAFDTDQPSWTAFTGQTVEQHRGWGWLDVIHPDDREKSGRAWAAAVAGKGDYQVEHRLRRADGVYRHMSVRAVPILDADGTIREWVGVHTDVHEHRMAEQAARDSEKRFTHVLGSSPAVLFTLSVADDRIQGIGWISDNLLAVLGYRPDEVVGGPDWWTENIHPDDREKVIESNGKLFVHGQNNQEYRLRHGDGRYRWLRDDLRLIRDAAGQAVEAVGSWTDITEWKSLEVQFRQAQKMDAFGQLAGGVAHDFNNLLTIINGYCELLLESLSHSDPSRQMIVEIHKAGERSAGLTRQLLAFSRQQVLAARILNLNNVVADTDKMLRRLIGEDVRLTTTLETHPWAVKADPGQVEQVLLNLAVNARDAMPKGGRLTIETKNVELDASYVGNDKDVRAGRHVLLSVSDTGSGMPAAVLAKVFEPFFTTKEPGKGTGLGLATVYGIVKQSGGHVAVDSKVGVGTTFKVYLPQAEQEHRRSRAPSRIVAPPRGTETVLLVEDESAVRVLTRTILTGCGYRVLEAADGEGAVRAAGGHDGPIHLLITDVVMPGSGGRAVAEQMTEQYPRIRVIYISGYTDDAVIRHGVLRDGVNFLQKPFTPAALARRVRDVLDGTA